MSTETTKHQYPNLAEQGWALGVHRYSEHWIVVFSNVTEGANSRADARQLWSHRHKDGRSPYTVLVDERLDPLTRESAAQQRAEYAKRKLLEAHESGNAALRALSSLGGGTDANKIYRTLHEVIKQIKDHVRAIDDNQSDFRLDREPKAEEEARYAPENNNTD